MRRGGHQGGLQTAEAGRLPHQVDDVADPELFDGGGAFILIRRAKNDPFGDGRLGYLSPPTIGLLDAWLQGAGVGSGWMLRRVHGKRIGAEALHPCTVNRVIKSSATDAGLAPKTVRSLSGHSMRVGAAQDMMTRGLGILPIMKAGGWKSMNVVGRYVENAEFEQLLGNRFEETRSLAGSNQHLAQDYGSKQRT